MCAWLYGPNSRFAGTLGAVVILPLLPDGRFAFLVDRNGRHLSVPQQLDAGLDHPRIVPATGLRLKLIEARRQSQCRPVRTGRQHRFDGIGDSDDPGL